MVFQKALPTPCFLKGPAICSGLSGSPPKREVCLAPVNVNLLKERVFADVIKSRISRRDHPGLGWALNPTAVVLTRGRQGENETQRGEGHMRTEAETGVMQPQSSECQGLLVTTRSEERGMQQVLPQTLQKEPTLPSSWFWTSSL